MKTSRKALAIVLSVAMILSTMVFSIGAVDFDETWKAITTAAELKAIEDDLAGKYYLANDITLTGDFKAIGWLDSGDTAFTGTFDGNGKTVSGLTIASGSNNGLFAINGGTIKNLTVKDASVTVSTQGGIIAGVNNKDGVISNCTVSDSIVAGSFETSTRQRYWLLDGYQVGGIAGLNNGTVYQCVNSDTDVRGWYEVGGIVGHNNGTVSQCASTGDINSTNSGAASQGQVNRFRYAAEAAERFSSNGVAPLAYGRAGGIVGYNAGDVSDVYVTAPKGKELVGVAGFNSVGGVCGANVGTIKNAYSAHTQFTLPDNNSALYYPNGKVNGYDGTRYSWTNKYFHPLVGSQQGGTTEDSFYSEIVSGSLPSASFNEAGRGEEKSDDEMKNESIYKEAGWDFDNVWSIDSDSKLPILKFLAADTDCKHENTEVVGKKDPTCTEPGYTGDTVCKDCGKVLEKGEEIPATGNHVWNDGVVTKKATCTEAGEKTYTCTVCCATKSETIPATGHDYQVVGRKDATCDEDGYTGDEVCKNCGDVKSTGSVIPAKGHHDANGDGKCDDCGKDIGGGSHDNGNTSGGHRFFDSLLNWFTRLMILVRHLLGMTA